MIRTSIYLREDAVNFAKKQPGGMSMLIQAMIDDVRAGRYTPSYPVQRDIQKDDDKKGS